MKIRNVSPLGELRIHPRGAIGWDPDSPTAITVPAGGVVDLPDEVAGRPPSPEHVAAHVALMADAAGSLSHEERSALVERFVSSDAGAGLLAQWDVWQPVDVKAAKGKASAKATDEEEAG